RIGVLGCVFLVTVVQRVFPAELPANAPKVGFLVTQSPGEILGPEIDTACDLARHVTGATVILPAGGGKFVDLNGREISTDQLRVIWCHKDESSQPKQQICDTSTVEALRRFVSAGHGLLLSGSSVTLIESLGIDTVRIRTLGDGRDRGQAGLVPLDLQHPAFRDADLARGILWLSNAVFPAFAEFHPMGNPARGMILARTPGGHENPLVEYQLGQGRIIAMGWRIAKLYGEVAADYRKRFERLVSNLASYLGDSKTWRPMKMRPDGHPLVAVSSATVSESEWNALKLAISDLCMTFGDKYPKGADYLKQLTGLKKTHDELSGTKEENITEPVRKNLAGIARQFVQLRSEALLANPLLDFSRLLLIKRNIKQLGLPANYLSNSSLPQKGYDNQIAVLSPIRPDGKLTMLYQPDEGRFVGDVDLHFDADRLLFSMSGVKDRWRVFEIRSDGSNLHELPMVQEPDVDNYDACYLPDDRIVFSSSACFAGVPCINGSGHVVNLYLLGTNGKIRQLTVDQDHDWCPTVLNNGRILYLRWEYTDLPHPFSRILFHMNPDGTGQMEYYGSNSYWPASMFYARPIPNHPTKFVAITGGHHELPRMGEMFIFDPAQGRHEADGVVQQIPGYGRKVAPVILDLPISQSWPKFLHPFPLSEKYFLVSCKPAADALWGIYLVDTFDNMVLIHEEPGYAMFEPVPLRKTPRPPVVSDKVDLARDDAEVLISDIYLGEGLRGVPRGTIRSLRIISYEYAYQGMGAEPYSVGMDGPWDPKQVLGTVPVYEDGSAHFRIPACTPVALQPLDAEGRAVQLMRSWMTAMPGEVVSCVGCHEKQNTLPPIRKTIAVGTAPVDIKPWYGPVRGFAFCREVQPVLDKYCIKCHNGKPRPDGRSIPCLLDGPPVPTMQNNNGFNLASRFSPSYYQVRRFVRTPTKESDMHLLTPWEYHASTTRLVQMLEKGHHDVRLNAESWDRLITWIDLNAPAHGNWNDLRGSEIGPKVKHQVERRRQMRKLYTGMENDPEIVVPSTFDKAGEKTSQSAGSPVAVPTGSPAVSGNSSTEIEEASVSQDKSSDDPSSFSIPLGDGISLEMVRIPAGEFVMGQDDGCADERPSSRVKIKNRFWLGRCEITNEQFARFDPSHDSRLEDSDFMHFSPGERAWILSRPRQPVVRVSWNRAMPFCQWLSQKTGRSFSLPTEAQWEYACRAGTTTPLWYGPLDSDFSRFANLSDASHQEIDDFGWAGGIRRVIPPWRPADTRFNDQYRVSASVGTYRPNPWGLLDIHGNVAEWTRSEYRPYPYRGDDGRNLVTSGGKRVVRGGSWYDRPDRCRSAFRQVYLAEQPVYDVGFRVVCW
ncbi:MAG: SUMF1/EgtB/PvdO family nonheme iron enzyme, partial [Kiritimatiellae bacterium]|nr:SUMF1/EgtB/PvdO family nonheme iron enzyme [Kiritimatiellia bacterium]